MSNAEPKQFRIDEWPLPDVLTRLADAADHLLADHNCDMHGHEGISFAVFAARQHAGRADLVSRDTAPQPRLLTVEALEAVTNYFWAADSPVLSEGEVQSLVDAALRDIKASALDEGTLRWAANWLLDSLKGETNERVIEFAKNMAMTLRAAALQDSAPAPSEAGAPANYLTGDKL